MHAMVYTLASTYGVCPFCSIIVLAFATHIHAVVHALPYNAAKIYVYSTF